MIIPFIPEDLFQPGDDHQVRFENGVLIVDNWYRNFADVQAVLKNMSVPRWKWSPTGRNFVDYYDCRPSIPGHWVTDRAFNGVNQILSHIRTFYRDTSPLRLMNHLFEFNYFRNIKRDMPNTLQHHPHTDFRYNCLVYIDDVCSGGTALYEPATVPNTEEHNLLYDVSRIGKRVIASKPNRLVVFSGKQLHGGYIEDHNAYLDDWRINQIMFFDEKKPAPRPS
jgi:hypothetical protein